MKRDVSQRHNLPGVFQRAAVEREVTRAEQVTADGMGNLIALHRKRTGTESRTAVTQFLIINQQVCTLQHAVVGQRRSP